jgi:LysR family transcriptional regulator, benzoate and cis,cis-muconate-responsive activator of ben and cat genes
MALNLRHLNYFIVVADELNVTRAADRLNMSQPPLSRQIQQFEDELQVKLFDRTGGRLRLTEAGRFVYEQANQVLARIFEIQEAARRIGKLGHRWLNVGFAPSTLYGLLADVIRDFRRADPGTEVGLLELTTVQQFDALKSGRIDVGFGRIPLNDPVITSEVVSEEPLVAVVPSGHRFSHRSTVTMEMLSKEQIILYPVRPRPCYADHVIEQFRSRGLAINPVREVNEVQTALGLVAAGVGVTLVPSSVKRARHIDVSFRTIKDSGVTSPVIMSYRVGDDSAVLLRFLKGVELIRKPKYTT